MSTQQDLPALEDQRDRLFSALTTVGDFRPGSVTHVPRRCGKPNCACADPDHPGHVQHRLTKKVDGKTATISLRPGPLLEKVEREVANYRTFKGLVSELVGVNEQICETRPLDHQIASGQQPEAEKGGPSGRRSRPSSPRK